MQMGCLAGAAGQFRGVGQRVRQQRLQLCVEVAVAGLAAHGRHQCRIMREPKAAFRLGAHVPPQLMAPGPARGQLRQRNQRAADQFEFHLMHGQAPLTRNQMATVQRQLDHRALMVQPAVQSLDVGAVDRLQCSTHAQRALQGFSQGRAVVPAGVQRGFAAHAAQHHLVLEAAGQAVAAAFQRLHPDPALLAHPQHQAGRSQMRSCGVGIQRPQPRGVRACSGHGLMQHTAMAARDLKFEFGFDD